MPDPDGVNDRRAIILAGRVGTHEGGAVCAEGALISVQGARHLGSDDREQPDPLVNRLRPFDVPLGETVRGRSLRGRCRVT